ncbi:sigma-70 family RNA polymerase sigma factor [Methylobrevis albus]|uniref:RNA polymerase sigma factor n=1 Tax=Methylobrevis albus TaxID=2793297 RepID=A0A931MYR2_9HYPH|nr:sigma-70 family RNA polymerase sigma factor [Methylobrevis albus]MBH0237264.1 sigma-70 family RNA polymerase sigma factor [Methylobrevis albus]
MTAPATPSTNFRDGLLAEIPSLRAFAISLCGKLDRADDLVQETLMKAWAANASFTEGTNLRAWLFTILRNVYFSQLRRTRREVEDADGKHAATLSVVGEQHARLDLGDFKEALAKLPPDQREVLTLIGASGFSYEEAAEICGVPVGTIKSRLNRARARLTALLAIEHVSEIGPDATTLAATGPAIAGRLARA